MNICCPICGNSQGLLISVNFKKRIPGWGLCPKRCSKPYLWRKFGKFSGGCGATFKVFLKSKSIETIKQAS